MGKSKKSTDTPAPDPNGVDMDHIKELMGPLPNEQALPPADTKKSKAGEVIAPTTAPEVPKQNQEITAAAEEANESIRAMAPDLGKSAITKIVDEPVMPVDPSIFDDETPMNEGVVADDPATVSAVDAIVAQEGDKVLEAEDEAREGEAVKKTPESGFKQRLKELWAKPAVRWASMVGLVLLVAAIVGLPASRYFILNNVGVRSSVGVTVIDNSTQLPLKNVTVSAAGVSAITDSNGNAKLEHVKLGSTTLHITKRAFATLDRRVTIGWGSNPLGSFRVSPAGEQYTFIVTDFLSGKTLEKAQASGEEGNAASDKTGKIILTLDTSNKADSDILSVDISLDGYRNETVKFASGTKTTTQVKLVSAYKDVFVSNRSGKYDIYTVDIDGKNEKKIISGSGLERNDLALVPLQNSNMTAFAATRENVRNSDGYLLTTLYMLDEDSGILTKVDQSEQIQMIGWSSDGRLIYVKIAAGTSSGNNKRFRLVSLNSKNTGDIKELASANYFNDVVLAGNKVLYSPYSALQDANPGLYSINTDGSGSVRVTDKEIYNIFRTDYSTVTVDAGGHYYTYPIGSAASSFASTTTPATTNHLYIDNTNGSKSLWTDTRDGKGVLLNYDKTSKKDTSLATVAGLKLPVRWLSDTVAIYRVSDGKQTSDYAVSTEGGQPVKITELTDVEGVTRWYYY